MTRGFLVALALAMPLAACGGDSITTPGWAEGVSGPTVVDESGLVAGWEYIGYPDESDTFLQRPGGYTGDFGVDTTTPGSTELIVTWGGLPCQNAPVSRVIVGETSIHVDVAPGPNPVEHCAAMEVRYGLRLTLTEPLADREVTASLVDPVNQKRHDYP
jgi:hypothetical protein